MFEVAQLKQICSYFEKQAKTSIQLALNTTDKRHQQSFMDDPLDDATTKILCAKYNLMNEEFSYNTQRLFYVKYFYPIILTFGIFSNIVSFCIMIKMYNQKKNAKFALSLAILSITDLAVLIFGCMSDYTEHILDFSLRSSSIYICKFMFYSCYLFSCYSAYMHAWICFDRYKSIVNPIRSNALKSKRKRKTIFGIFILSLVLSAPFIYFAHVNEVLTLVTDGVGQKFIHFKEQCELHQNEFALDLAQALIDLLIYEFTPLLIIIVYSSLSIKELIRNRGVFKIVKDRNFSTIDLHHDVVEVVVTYKMSKNVRNPVSQSNMKTTLMLSIIPISYLLTKLPIFVIILLKLKNNFLEKENSKNVYAREYEIAKTLMYFNYSINIFYYVFLGQNYRNKFFLLIRKRKSTMKNIETFV
jgi:hypothetical protein